MRDSYRTLAAPQFHGIPKIKGSRFLGQCVPVADQGAAEAFVARQRKEHWSATHHVFAYRLGGKVADPAGAALRASDDGEPAGSAGRPVLQQIEARQLFDLVVVVSRWFGGTKLGAGGLARAYGAAASEVLQRSTIRVVTMTETLHIEHDYECVGAVQSLLATTGLHPTSAAYGPSVRMVIEVPVRQVERFLAELRDRTAGRVRIDRA
jgi:uncharacterized YigZ family protein